MCVIICGQERAELGTLADLDMVVAVGFGSAVITCDGELLLDGEPPEYRTLAAVLDTPSRSYKRRLKKSAELCRRGWLTLRRVEKYLSHRASSGAPVTGVIEASLNGPLSSSVWRRIEPMKWALIEKGEGFA